MRRLRILTWHVHGSYLDSLVRSGHDFFLPVKPDGTGSRGDWGWPDTVHDIPEERVRELDVDLVLYQHEANRRDAPRILSDRQLRGPRVHVEHDPPQGHPTDTRHPVDDPDALLVHVTPFNDLMWDTGRTPTRVIEHGVAIPDGVRYTGELDRGIVVVNNIRSRGRRLGLDVFERRPSLGPARPRRDGRRVARRAGRGQADRPARVRGPVPVLLQPDPVHEPRAGDLRGDDGRPADRRAGDDRDADGHRGRRSRGSSTPMSTA